MNFNIDIPSADDAPNEAAGDNENSNSNTTKTSEDTATTNPENTSAEQTNSEPKTSPPVLTFDHLRQNKKKQTPSSQNVPTSVDNKPAGPPPILNFPKLGKKDDKNTNIVVTEKEKVSTPTQSATTPDTFPPPAKEDTTPAAKNPEKPQTQAPTTPETLPPLDTQADTYKESGNDATPQETALLHEPDSRKNTPQETPTSNSIEISDDDRDDQKATSEPFNLDDFEEDEATLEDTDDMSGEMEYDGDDLSIVLSHDDFIQDLLEGEDEEYLNPEDTREGDYERHSKHEEEDEEPLSVTVPDKPEMDPHDAHNAATREARQQAWRARHTRNHLQGKDGDRDDQVGYERPISYVVKVDEEGNDQTLPVPENTETGADTSPKFDAEKVIKSPKKVEIKNTEGQAKWQINATAGRLTENQMSVFANLNRSRRSEDSHEIARTVFSKIDQTDTESIRTKERNRRLANRAIYGDKAITKGSRVRFTEKDRDVIRFIGMFKYANSRHISRIHQVKEETVVKRLGKLEERGLVWKKDLYGTRPVWLLTESGMIASGLELKQLRESDITYTMLPHSFVVNHVAGNLWGGGVNSLALEDFPSNNRLTEKGTYALGETLVSENEIQSSFGAAKAANHKAEVYRPAITGVMNKEFTQWQKAGGVSFGPSPEQIPGNEYMWTLFPPFALRLAYHVPDLVVNRPRNDDGTPNSIAVEIELANKPIASYERALNAYKYDKLIYKKVIWVVKSRGAARKLREAAIKIGTWNDGRVGIVPIYTEEGIFKGKAEWTI